MKAFQYDGTNSIMDYFGDVIKLHADSAGILSALVRTCITDDVPLNINDWVVENDLELITVMTNEAFKYTHMSGILKSMPFIKWYSGATEEMIMRAYKRFMREEINQSNNAK